MPSPRILLLSRKAITEQHPDLMAFLGTVPPTVAICQSEEDASAAKTICEVVGTFQNVTAIVGDFPGCLYLNDDGSVEPILTPEAVEPPSEPLIKLVE